MAHKTCCRWTRNPWTREIWGGHSKFSPGWWDTCIAIVCHKSILHVLLNMMSILLIQVELNYAYADLLASQTCPQISDFQALPITVLFNHMYRSRLWICSISTKSSSSATCSSSQQQQQHRASGCTGRCTPKDAFVHLYFSGWDKRHPYTGENFGGMFMQLRAGVGPPIIDDESWDHWIFQVFCPILQTPIFKLMHILLVYG